mgnify:CR=1 FL=1
MTTANEAARLKGRRLLEELWLIKNNGTQNINKKSQIMSEQKMALSEAGGKAIILVILGQDGKYWGIINNN